MKNPVSALYDAIASHSSPARVGVASALPALFLALLLFTVGPAAARHDAAPPARDEGYAVAPYTGASAPSSGAHPTAASDPTAAESAPSRTAFDSQKAVERAVAAHGGAEAVRKSETEGRRRGSYTQFFPARNAGTFVEWRKGDKVLIEVQLGGIEVTQGYDGRRAWVRSLGQVIDAPKQVQTAIEEEQRHSLTLLTVAGGAVEAAGADSALDATPIRGVRVTPSGGGPPTEFYFDPETGRVAKMSFTDVNPYKGGQAKFDVYFQEYKEIGDVAFPSKLVHFIDGVKMDEIVYESVDFNAQIEDAIFMKPETSGAEAPRAGAGTSGNELRVEVPLDFSLNLLFVDVTVDDDETHRKFILDTGAGMTCLSKELAADLGLEATGGMSAAGAGGALDAETAAVDSIRIGDLTVADLDVMVIDMAPMSEMMGMSIDGIVGYNVLNRYATTIDIAGGSLLFESADAPLPAGGNACAVPFEVLMGVPLVEGSVDGAERIDFIVDSGASTSLLPKDVAERLKPAVHLEGTVAAGADSREIDLAVARFEKLALGDAVAEKPVFSYPLKAQRHDPLGSAIDTANRGIIGTGILKDFRVTINYDKATMVLQPAPPSPEEALEWCGPGLNVYMNRGDFVVRSVFKGGPADGSIEQGDRLLEIDGADLRGMTLDQVVRMLRGEPGTDVKILIDRSGEKKTITLKRARLL